MNIMEAKDVRAMQKEIKNVHSDLNIITDSIKETIFTNPHETKILYTLKNELTYNNLPELSVREKILVDALERLGYKVEYRWAGDPWLDHSNCHHDDDTPDESDDCVLEISWKD